jgi:hypothetical protein
VAARAGPLALRAPAAPPSPTAFPPPLLPPSPDIPRLRRLFGGHPEASFRRSPPFPKPPASFRGPGASPGGDGLLPAHPGQPGRPDPAPSCLQVPQAFPDLRARGPRAAQRGPGERRIRVPDPDMNPCPLLFGPQGRPFGLAAVLSYPPAEPLPDPGPAPGPIFRSLPPVQPPSAVNLRAFPAPQPQGFPGPGLPPRAPAPRSLRLRGACRGALGQRPRACVPARAPAPPRHGGLKVRGGARPSARTGDSPRTRPPVPGAPLGLAGLRGRASSAASGNRRLRVPGHGAASGPREPGDPERNLLNQWNS